MWLDFTFVASESFMSFFYELLCFSLRSIKKCLKKFVKLCYTTKKRKEINLQGDLRNAIKFLMPYVLNKKESYENINRKIIIKKIWDTRIVIR